MNQQGYLLIADITGYTEVLSETELEHAEDILRNLFNALTNQVKSPWTLHELEGDAIFAHVLDGGILQAQTLLELVEHFYRVFAKTLENRHRNITCQCKACKQIQLLDLKVIIHYGPFALNGVGGREKLTGEDAIVIHRLLKNKITEITGVSSYAFFTEAAVQAMPLAELTQTMKMHTEEYEHLGRVSGFVHDLQLVWKHFKKTPRLYVDSTDSSREAHGNFSEPPSVVWDCLTEPDNWKQWTLANRMSITGKHLGRVDVGTEQHRTHGRQTLVHTVVDWKPFDYFTMDTPIPLKGIMQQTIQLSETKEGTRISWYLGKPTAKNMLHAILLKLVVFLTKGTSKRGVEKGFEFLSNLMESNQSEHERSRHIRI